MKLHIANLSPKITEQHLEQLFTPYGQVLGVQLNWIETAGRTAGSALIEMHATEALAAIKELNGRAFRNRRLYITPISGSKKDDIKAIKKPQTQKALKKKSGWS